MTQPNISIGIVSAKEISFELYGEFAIAGVGKKLSGKFKAKMADNSIKLIFDGKEILSKSEIVINPIDIETESFLLKDVVIGINFHWQKKEKQRFRGKLKFIIEKDLITAVNILPLEEYLTSVISSEMSPNSSLELLKAHAVVSRSWLLAQLAKKSKIKSYSVETDTEEELIRWYDREDHLNYDFCADDHCQRYQGIGRVVNDHAVAAINATRGLILIYNNEICDTRYSKCCGGITELFENVWENTPHKYLEVLTDYKYENETFIKGLTEETLAAKWIKSNPNAFCNTSDAKILKQVLVDFDQSTKDFFRWNVEYSQEEISNIIKEKSGYDFGEILDLIPVERGTSSRLTKLKIVGSKKVKTIGKELEIRRTLSKSHLYSSSFIVSKEDIVNGVPQKFILEGAGWGHGVGLCQIGAAVMGEMGYSFDAILMHYFRGAAIHKGYS